MKSFWWKIFQEKGKKTKTLKKESKLQFSFIYKR